MKYSCIFAVSLALGAVGVAALAQSPSMKPPSAGGRKQMLVEMAAKTALPTEEHKALAALVGNFDERTEVHMGPGEPVKVHSMYKASWIMGGRFVRVESNSATDEELKGEREVVYGYDPVAKKYTLWNVESGSLTATTATGDYDAASKTFTFDGERENGQMGKVPFRWVIKIEEGGVISQTILMKFPNAADFVPLINVKRTPVGK